MQSSVVVAVAQATVPLLWRLHCWHLRCSSGPTAHHTTRARRASTSADAARRDTASTGALSLAKDTPRCQPPWGLGSTLSTLPAWPSRGCGPILFPDGRVSGHLPRPLHCQRPAPSQAVPSSPCFSVPFLSWLLIYPSLLSVTTCLISQSHRIKLQNSETGTAPQRWPRGP